MGYPCKSNSSCSRYSLSAVYGGGLALEIEIGEEGGFRLSFLHGCGLVDWMCCFIFILGS